MNYHGPKSGFDYLYEFLIRSETHAARAEDQSIPPVCASSKIDTGRLCISVPARAIQYDPVREMCDSTLRWTWWIFLPCPNLQ